ncbi:MAG: hypothetical protein ACRDD8_14195 [Bacteroidales bacterium]
MNQENNKMNQEQNNTHKLDWTHKNVYIDDIRLNGKMYVFNIKRSKTAPIQLNRSFPFTHLTVEKGIFEDQLRNYFFKDISEITREEILSCGWNLVVTKGFFYKIDRANNTFVAGEQMQNEKYYVSFIRIHGSLTENFDIKR